jgi:hypothetical protein
MSKVKIKHTIWFKNEDGTIKHILKSGDIIDCHINKEEGIYNTPYGGINLEDCEIIIEGRNC